MNWIQQVPVYFLILSKLKAMESQKNKLAQEIEIIVKQFESSQVTIKELNLRCAASDKKCDELEAMLIQLGKVCLRNQFKKKNTFG